MSTPSSASPSSSNDQVDKVAKKTKIVTFHLPPEQLQKFSPPRKEEPSRKISMKTKTNSNSNSSSASTPAMPAPSTSSGDNASEPNSTPVPPPSIPPAAPTETTKRKGIPGPKPGHKRALGQGVETLPKPRGKPGPKKKPRLCVCSRYLALLRGPNILQRAFRPSAAITFPFSPSLTTSLPYTPPPPNCPSWLFLFIPFN
jgi:hypothetical protein